MFEYFKVVAVTFFASIAALWGVLEGFTYFMGNALKKLLGPYWWLLLLGVPLFIAVTIAGSEKSVVVAEALGVNPWYVLFLPPSGVALCVGGGALFVRARSRAARLSLRRQALRLREKPSSLSPGDVVGLIAGSGFNHPDDLSNYKLSGSITTGTLQHRYEPRTLAGEEVVVDHATQLMWQKSGSPYKTSWKEAAEYVASLTATRVAGHGDWRLPTVEELASLLEPVKRGELYVSVEFGPKQFWCWSADRVGGLRSAWFVDFGSGLVDSLDVNVELYVRAVRTCAPDED